MAFDSRHHLCLVPVGRGDCTRTIPRSEQRSDNISAGKAKIKGTIESIATFENVDFKTYKENESPSEDFASEA